MEMYINIDLEMKSLTIRYGVYGCYDYECKNLNEVGEIVQEFVNEYVKGE